MGTSYWALRPPVVHMEGRNKDATIESRMDGGEILKQYYQDHVQALIEEKATDSCETERGGDETIRTRSEGWSARSNCHPLLATQTRSSERERIASESDKTRPATISAIRMTWLAEVILGGCSLRWNFIEKEKEGEGMRVRVRVRVGLGLGLGFGLFLALGRFGSVFHNLVPIILEDG